MEDSQTGWMERRAFALTDPGQRPHSNLASWSLSPNLFFDFHSFLFFFKLFSLFFFCRLSWEWQQGIQFVTLTVCPVASSVTPSPTINYLWAVPQTLQSPTSARAPKASGTILMQLVIITEILDAPASLAFFTAFLQCHPGSWPSLSKDRIPQSPFSTWPELLWRNN